MTTKLLLIFDLDDTLFSRLPDNYTEKDLQGISLLPGARELLERHDVLKVLVSQGEREFQLQKIEILGIKPLFDALLICTSPEEKKQCFEKVLQEFPGRETWIIGDRIEIEVRYGNELGCKTIHLNRGKYKDLIPRDKLEIPHYQATEFVEVQKIIDRNRK